MLVYFARGASIVRRGSLLPEATILVERHFTLNSSRTRFREVFE